MSSTIAELFFCTANKYGLRKALGYKVDGEYHGNLSWQDWSNHVTAVALGLEALGVKRGDKIGILSENCPQWTFADLGALTLGAVVVPMYPTLSSSDLEFITENSETKVLFVSTVDQYQKVCSLTVNRKIQVVAFCEKTDASVMSLQELEAKGRDYKKNLSAGWLEDRLSRITQTDLATLIYTSGTTGLPKGVMLTHANFMNNYLGAAKRIRISESDIALSFLPLSHVFERLAGYYFMAFSGAQIYYAESMLTVAEDIKKVRPTVAAAVPRFYEKVYGNVQARLQGSELARKVFKMALTFRKMIRAKEAKGVALSFLDKIRDRLFDRIVFSKIRAGLGGRIRFFISGGAPLSRELAEFFDLCGVLILEGYGLTETSPVIAVNTVEEHRFGTVGKPLDNIQVKISAEGEILTAGPCVMQGYYRNPEATAEALRDGWFHTGDIGAFDADGYLKITDRLKDLIVTAGGKKVAPQKLEALVLRDPLFSQVVALGDKKPCVVALVVLNRTLATEGAKMLGLESLALDQLIDDKRFFEWVEGRLQKQIEGVARFESIKTFAILQHEFSIQSGELTPTLKVKRRFVMEKYAALIEPLYHLHE